MFKCISKIALMKAKHVQRLFQKDLYKKKTHKIGTQKTKYRKLYNIQMQNSIAFDSTTNGKVYNGKK